MQQFPIPITIITGFLGSGKTTLLSSLLEQEEMAGTAVIINEFGEIGLDHALVERSNDNLIELQSGCICCTIRNDLSNTLLELVDRMTKKKISPFNRVVVETTGLADPVPIIHMLTTMTDLLRAYKLDGVVTVVDASNGDQTLDEYEESVKQTAIAERIILSKTDIASEAKTKLLLQRLASLNPSADVIQTNHGEIVVSSLFGLGAYDPYQKPESVKKWLKHEAHHSDHHHDHNHHHVNRHSEKIEAFSFVYDEPIHFSALAALLHYLSGLSNADLIRVKGIINVKNSDKVAVIHGVQGVFYPVQWLDEWPDSDHRTKLVFITRSMTKEQVEQLFVTFIDMVEAAPPAPKKAKNKPVIQVNFGGINNMNNTATKN